VEFDLLFAAVKQLPHGTAYDIDGHAKLLATKNEFSMSREELGTFTSLTGYFINLCQ
jgi:hypothetical protein